MRFQCTNTDCGNEHAVDSYTMSVRDGEVRYKNGSDDLIDLCPQCGSRCKEIRVFKGFATMRGGVDTGNGGKSNAR